MAQKFNDGQTFGAIRDILNGNAEELNATTNTANEAVKVANSFDTAPYVSYGRVFAPSGSERGVKGKDNGSLWFNGGKAYTIDYVMTSGIDMFEGLMEVCADKGDVSVLLSGSYRGGWKGSAAQTYHGVARVHYVANTNYVAVEAVDTDAAEMYVLSNDTSNRWVKVGKAAADEALQVANEAKTTATAAKTAADTANATLEKRKIGDAMGMIFAIPDLGDVVANPLVSPVAVYTLSPQGGVDNSAITIVIPTIDAGKFASMQFRVYLYGTPLSVGVVGDMPAHVTCNDYAMIDGRTRWTSSVTYREARARYGVNPAGVEVVITLTVQGNSPNGICDVQYRALFNEVVSLPTTASAESYAADFAAYDADGAAPEDGTTEAETEAEAFSEPSQAGEESEQEATEGAQVEAPAPSEPKAAVAMEDTALSGEEAPDAE